MKLPERLEKAIDIIGLIIALVVDLIVIPICMITIAPDFLTKIAFLCIGVTIVLFVFRSWAKGQKGAWFIFAAVVFFFDFSFAIVATQVQTEKAITATDTEIARIDVEISKAQEQIKKLRDERTISTRPETIASISDDIKTEEQNIKEFNAERKIREKELKKTGGVFITADSVFTSIPDAMGKKRYIPLIVFGLIFLGLQAVVITSIDSPDKTKKEEIKKELKKPEVDTKPRKMTIDLWVRILWYGVKSGKPRIPSETVTIKYCKEKNLELSLETHKKYVAYAIESGLIDSNGLILKDEEEALEIMKIMK